MNPVLAASLLAGALALDNRSSLRLMISQPVCGGLLVGFALGSPREGLLAGAVLQMMFLGMIPVRGIGMSDLALGGVAVSSLYILALRSAAVDPAAKGLVLLLSLAASLGVAAAGRCVYRFWESRSHVFADAALRLAGRGRFALASALHFSTLAIHFAVGFAVTAAVVIALVPAVAWIAAAAWGKWAEPLASLSVLLPFIGAGSLFALNLGRVRGSLFLAGFCAVVLVLVFRS
jgi:mannose/fructose/N-acetylgalactosamine-specific phosphotransferase system component IIC